MQVHYNIDSIEIEHIYPQNPSQVDDTLEPLKNTIGNLTFWSTTDNKSAGNNPFGLKQDYYSSSNIALTRDLADLNDCNANTVQNREELYKDMAVLVFGITENTVASGN